MFINDTYSYSKDANVSLPILLLEKSMDEKVNEFLIYKMFQNGQCRPFQITVVG